MPDLATKYRLITLEIFAQASIVLYTMGEEFLLGDTVKYKKYFYVLRPILACKWILAEGTPPPMEFHILMEKYLDEDLKPDVEKLLDLKMNSPEIAIGKRFDRVNEYIYNAIAELDTTVSTLPSDKIESWDELNNMFLEMLK